MRGTDCSRQAMTDFELPEPQRIRALRGNRSCTRRRTRSQSHVESIRENLVSHVMNRRRFVLGSGALIALAATGRAARALEPMKVPAVDTLVVKVLTDSSYDTPRAVSNRFVKVKRAGLASPLDFRKTLHNEWGLALALESRIGSDSRFLMLDYGYTPEALLGNMQIMGVDATKMNALILSHGHYDHFGGLLAFLEKYRAQLPSDLTLYVGGEDNFCIRKSVAGAPGHFSDFGALDRRELARLNVKVVTCESPTVIEGHAFTTGTIARKSFEKVLPNTVVSYHKENGLGCDIPAADAKAEGKLVADQHLDEHATCFDVKDRGLVVISSCGHVGIVNSVRQAIEVSGVRKVHAIMGGFHLFPADDEYVRRVVTELRAFDPDVIIPLHCSGPAVITAMREQAPEKLITSTTGTEFTFGA
jgi:7,8-dihydropterin-6-yl-methyl-4-(beta-D-ribofuranosyl)aminobenzene 5'-phosphate synthase